MKLFASFLLILTVALISCSDDNSNDPGPTGDDYNLKINEFVAAGSLQLNEYDENSDWFEIYNDSDEAVELKKGIWFFSDDIGNPEKWALPIDTTIAANGFLLIWCDDHNTYETQIHTSFKLSSAGETICISYNNGDETELIDSKEYFNAEDSLSYGRFPDGTDTWEEFDTPTPGTSNVK